MLKRYDKMQSYSVYSPNIIKKKNCLMFNLILLIILFYLEQVL